MTDQPRDEPTIRTEVADAIRDAVWTTPGITPAARRALLQEIDRAEKPT